MRLLKSALMLASLLSAFAASGEAARAADYPAGPVKIVVPYPAGGPTDFIARVVAQKLTEKLGGQFIVENLPGAGGAVGTGAVARAPADGRTIAFVVPDFVIAPIVKANVPFDPFKSFTPLNCVVLLMRLMLLRIASTCNWFALISSGESAPVLAASLVRFCTSNSRLDTSESAPSAVLTTFPAR